MKRKLSKIVASFVAVILILPGMLLAEPTKALAAPDYPKVQGLNWKDGTYEGYWTPYDFDAVGATDPGYFVSLYKDGHAILENSAHKPGPMYGKERTSYKFDDLIKKNGPGTYTFYVSAYINGTADLQYTESGVSPEKIVEGEKYKLNISVSPEYAGRVSVNGSPVDSWVEGFQYQNMKLEAEPSTGFVFEKWTSTEGSTYETGSFWMPDREINVCAVFKEYIYTPNPRWKAGTFVANWNKYDGCRGYNLVLYKDSVQVGDPITVTNPNVDSYDFTSLIKANGKGTYSFGVWAVFVDSTKTGEETSSTQIYDEDNEIKGISFTLDKSCVTKLAEGYSAAHVKDELTSLLAANRLISGLNLSVKLSPTDPVRITSTILVSSELDDSVAIQKDEEYCLCFHFVPNQTGDEFASTVSGPYGEATLIREDAGNCYVYCPILSSSSGGSAPGPSPDPAPTPGSETKQNSVVSVVFPVDVVSTMIDAAKPGDTITYDFGDYYSFPFWFMQKVASRPDLKYVFKCNYKSAKYVFTINYGEKINLEFEWYGPFKMAELFDYEIMDENGAVIASRKKQKAI